MLHTLYIVHVHARVLALWTQKCQLLVSFSVALMGCYIPNGTIFIIVHVCIHVYIYMCVYMYRNMFTS